MDIAKRLVIKGSAFKEWWKERKDVRRININFCNDIVRVDDLKDDSYYTIFDDDNRYAIDISEIYFANNKDEVFEWYKIN